MGMGSDGVNISMPTSGSADNEFLLKQQQQQQMRMQPGGTLQEQTDMNEMVQRLNSGQSSGSLMWFHTLFLSCIVRKWKITSLCECDILKN